MSGDLTPERIAILRAMTLTQRLEAGLRHNEEFREARADFVQKQHPEWTEERVRRDLAAWTLRGYED